MNTPEIIEVQDCTTCRWAYDGVCYSKPPVPVVRQSTPGVDKIEWLHPPAIPGRCCCLDFRANGHHHHHSA